MYVCVFWTWKMAQLLRVHRFPQAGGMLALVNRICGMWLCCHTHFHVKQTVALPNQSGIKELQRISLPAVWGVVMNETFSSYKFLEAENILPFNIAALLLKCTALRYCMNSKPCVYVWVFLVGISYGSVYFLSLSRKLDTPPRPKRSSTFVFSDSGGTTSLPPSQPGFRKDLWLQFKGVCLYLCECVYVWVWESEKEGEIEVTCVQYKHLAHFGLNLCLCVSQLRLSSAFKYSGRTLLPTK